MDIVGLVGITNMQPWMELASCRETGPDDDTWFPEKWSRGRDGKRICAGCEVRAQCLQFALDNGERVGIWGGLGPKERELLNRGKRTFHRVGCPCSVCARRRRSA